MRRELKTLKDLEAVSRAAATVIEEAIEEEARRRAPFSLVLPGGSTPRRLFELLGTDWRDRLPWDRIHVFWTDERFVAPSHADSNYGLAKRLFLDRVPIPPEHVHRVPTERTDLQSAATAYDEEIRSY
ncbi:MAG: 6-phosphogluconolactonase, partial [Rhodothermales bacterium]